MNIQNQKTYNNDILQTFKLHIVCNSIEEHKDLCDRINNICEFLHETKTGHVYRYKNIKLVIYRKVIEIYAKHDRISEYNELCRLLNLPKKSLIKPYEVLLDATTI
jgi:hypothetical protein